MRFILLLLWPLLKHYGCESLPVGLKNFKVRPILTISKGADKGAILIRVRGGDTVGSATKTTENTIEAGTVNGEDNTEDNSHMEDDIRPISNVVKHILHNNEGITEESMELRQMIEQRAEEYLLELYNAESKPPTPMKVLHKMAPKIPAIKHSPDFMLRIQTARSDIDSGVAASLIATIARLCVEYELVTGESFGREVIKDRRFEQLVECVICGVDVRRRMVEAKQLMSEADDTEIDMEELLDEENVKSDEGLTVLDSCRAAWGISVLGGYHLESFGGYAAIDIITALSIRTREQLLARLQMLRNGELHANTPSELTSEKGFYLNSGCVAEDVASSIWTFACVKASTGLRTVSLFETCCSILCQDPADLREREIAKHTEDQEFQDVVDSLAESEVTSSVELDEKTLSSIEGTQSDDSRDALLHWLAPHAVSDIMWAVAVHGRTDDTTGSQQEMNLSETAAALSEIAFDVIIEALKQDLVTIKAAQPVREVKEDRGLLSEISEAPELGYIKQSSDIVVEIVDAAELIANHSSDKITPSIDESSQKIEKVQVVDAATLLSSTKDSEVETEVVYTTSPTKTFNENFSIHDICSIALAATDLNDSMRNILVDLIIEIFALKGNQALANLDGGQLSNLAWAIANRLSSPGYVPDHDVANNIYDLIEWITKKSLSLVNQDKKMKLLLYFEAPEVGRLMWSLATSLSKLSQSTACNRKLTSDFRDFALVALKASDSTSSRFGTEDLARITWGFLELSDLRDVLRESAVSAALGKIVSIMEQSIIRWESGQCEKQERNRNNTRTEESFPFSSFLGKPRLSLKLLEQRLDKSIHDDDEHSSTETEKSFRPLLRDLSMDPATMCKMAYGLSRTNVMFPELSGDSTFARVAVSLLKNGQLLKESTVSDCARLAFSCATNEVPGHRLYVRRLVRHLNRKLESTDQHYVSDQLTISPQELSILIWSLGELGVRHWTTEDLSEGSSYKKLRLVTTAQLLSESQLYTIPTKAVVRLLHGTISMEMLNSSPDLILPLLESIEVKLKADEQDVDLIELAECLAKIKKSVGGVEITTALPFDNTTEKADDNITGTLNTTCNTTTVEEDDDDDRNDEGQDILTAILLSNQRLLKLVAEAASESLHSLSANEIRRLLEIYAGLPFQAEKFVNATDVEIQKRLEAAHIVSNLHEAANRAALAARSSWDALADKSDDDESPLAALRKGLKNLFSNSPDNEGDDEHEREEEESSRLNEIADLLAETKDTSDYVTHNFALVSKLTNKDPGSLLSAEQRSAVFEMSRCQELIESYRRVNFNTGRRRSRHSTKRKEIGKNVISRMLNQK
mmetsp:Transcript_32651/g.49199  ORF Transcript_32651/g.49199 Transcript_32651/m.49199 type:complete len:1323 (+) Transcript_32651:138-4106(+)|eukprot:CAMPEP_0178895952 /NCGR_PEP_ID=MMETSP0786-20121207/877_1 /TAXON_ID=186022 /ORGANISM="Thalassionema frauenfeldii, Strain CCMP 1798" /LENGTH=1322 /DNA_ID=CAMNT_0020566249 /DNA_START=53 /DNA_END=4021 /DNA_ORIENTATION=+